MTAISKLMTITALVFSSCQNRDCNWPGGSIMEFGKYCNSEFAINVYERQLELNYEVRNSSGELLIKQDMSISTVHHWGLYMDRDGNFWVFSSDIGDCVWEMDPVTGKYKKKAFDRPLTKEDVPAELYESPVRRFLKN